MARMEQTIQNIVDLFVEYADGDGKLNKEELKQLVEKEIQNPELKAKLLAADFDKAMGRIDKNRDGQINFREFLKCLSMMAMRYYCKKTGKGQDDDE
ncbi:protein S100-A6-like [Leuresthes tenuis]|uniref:protein S100-A6-like n=1 Tax=Leuresthes tenuis TaxID=355514 RepID=UPI003B5144D4